IKSSQNALSEETDLLLSEWVYDLNEKLPVRVDKDTPIESIELLNQCRKKLMDSVAEEGMSANVTQFYLCHWGFTESVVWTKANKGWKIAREPKSKSVTKKDDSKEVEKESDSANMEIDDNVVEEKGEDLDQEEMSQEEKWPIEIVNMLQDTCKYYWQSCLGFECSFPKPSKSYTFPDMSRKESAGLVELLSSRQTLYTSYDFIMSEILMCLDKDAAYLRVKSLKAIRSISSQSPEILEEGRIRTSVVQRIHDTSPSVRDAAVEVIAKYLSQQQDVSYELYGLVSGRIMDTSVSVRKRLVKLLGELYFRFTDIEVKKDIASKLIMRIGDNEVTISQLSLKVTQKILFLPFKEIEKDGNDYFGSSYANATKDRKRCIDSLTGIITGAVAKLDSSVSTRNFALTQIVQKTIDGIDEEPRDWYEKIFQWINDSLFDRLMQLDQELDTTDFINCLATIHSFAKSCPNLLREIQITILQPYLSITEEDDYTIASYVLMIYRDVLPQMKHHGRSSIELLERILLQLLTRCPLDMVSASASCLCVIVSHISHRYNILIKILGSSVAKLRQTREAILHGNVTERTFSGVLKMILLCGLLCQHFEFDKRRQEEPHAMAALDLVYRGNIGILVYDLLKFYTGEDMEELAEQGMTLRTTALQGLGYFYSSYPTFMISEASTQLMDKIFREGTPSLKTKLMHVFQEFLGAEEGRIGKRDEEEKKGKDQRIGIDTLLGNTEEYAELGVNGSLMQRYLPKILECALSDLTELRYPAFDVVSTVIHCGLAHPVLCMPAIVAAETSPDISLRTKAYYMHKYAHDKYGSLLYIQMNEYINKSFQYQRLLFGSGVQGYGKRGGDAKIEAVLSLSYSILKEHKKSRFDFFYALIKPFLFELKLTNPEDIDITFLKYLAENMMMLDFATTNEVLFLVYHIDRLLMTLGADLLSFVQFLKKQGKMGEPEDMSEEDIDISMMEEDVITSSKLSIVLCMIMLLKKLLIELYDIPDQEIREYNPNNTRRPRDVMKDIEMSQTIEWEEEITYFQHNCLDRRTGIQACSKFEYLIMNDATAIVTTDFE
ncbi:Sister chromatid cohesion protein 2, partial [Rhizopus stolonifer]